MKKILTLFSLFFLIQSVSATITITSADNFSSFLLDLDSYMKKHSCTQENTLFLWDIDDTLLEAQRQSGKIYSHSLRDNSLPSILKSLHEQKFNMSVLTSRIPEKKGTTAKLIKDFYRPYPFALYDQKMANIDSHLEGTYADNSNYIYFTGGKYLKGQVIKNILKQNPNIRCTIYIDDNKAEINSVERYEKEDVNYFLFNIEKKSTPLKSKSSKKIIFKYCSHHKKEVFLTAIEAVLIIVGKDKK